MPAQLLGGVAEVTDGSGCHWLVSSARGAQALRGRHCRPWRGLTGTHSARSSSSVGPRSGAECAFCPAVCSQAEIEQLLPAMMQMPCKPEVLQRMQQLNAKKQKLTQGMEDGQQLPDSHACMHTAAAASPQPTTHLLLARARASWALMCGSCLPHRRTESLTKEKYLVMLGRCVAQDTKLAKALLQLGRKAEAAKVSQRIKLTQEERKAVEAS